MAGQRSSTHRKIRRLLRFGQRLSLAVCLVGLLSAASSAVAGDRNAAAVTNGADEPVTTPPTRIGYGQLPLVAIYWEYTDEEDLHQEWASAAELRAFLAGQTMTRTSVPRAGETSWMISAPLATFYWADRPLAFGTVDIEVTAYWEASDTDLEPPNRCDLARQNEQGYWETFHWWDTAESRHTELDDVQASLLAHPAMDRLWMRVGVWGGMIGMGDPPEGMYITLEMDAARLFGHIIPGSDEYDPGDVNCDGVVNNFDITPFVTIIAGTTPGYPEYYARWPHCDHMLADINDDGIVNNFDIKGFVDLISRA